MPPVFRFVNSYLSRRGLWIASTGWWCYGSGMEKRWGVHGSDRWLAIGAMVLGVLCGGCPASPPSQGTDAAVDGSLPDLVADVGDLGSGNDLGGPDLGVPDLGMGQGQDLGTADLGTPPTTVVSNPPICTSAGWCWENPLPQGNILSVWAAAPNDAWAVGGFGTTLHFDGQSWKWVDSGTDGGLLAIWGSSANHLWAVGEQGTALRWDGSRWSSIASGVSRNLWSIWGSSPNNVWAGGEVGTLLRWQGATWQPVPSGAAGTATIYGLWGSGLGDVWATRSGTTGTPVLRWDGTQLVAPATWPRTQTAARALWGEAADKVWFISTDPVRWDGQDFVIERLLTTVPGLRLWGSGPGDLWAMGSAVVQRGDGRNWTINVGPVVDSSARESLFSIHGSSPNDVWVSSNRPHQWNGSQWFTYGEGGPKVLLTDGWAADQLNAWVVGTRKNQAGQDVGPILKRNNGRWQEVFVAPEPLSGIWGFDGSDIWVCGDSGAIYHWNGNQWVKFPTGTSNYLHRVHGSDKNNIFAVGASGTILHWNGTSWLPEQSNITGSLNGVYSLSGTLSWAVGDGGLIVQRVGGVWKNAPTNISQDLLGIWALNGSSIWAVGTNGTILFYDGISWQPRVSGTAATITGARALSNSEVFFGTSDGALQWDGQQVRRISKRYFPIDVLSNFFTAGRTIWAINGRGFILRNNY